MFAPLCLFAIVINIRKTLPSSSSVITPEEQIYDLEEDGFMFIDPPETPAPVCFIWIVTRR